MENRRWFPDSLTELLLLRMHLSLEPDLGNPWQCIRTFLIESGITSGARPKNLSVLIKSIALDLQLKMPPFLINYATRSFISHSLKHHAWLRSHYLISENEASHGNVELSGKVDLDPETENEDAYFCTPTWTQEIRAALNQPTKKKASGALIQCHEQASTDEWPPLALLLVEWMQYLLSHGSRAGRPLALGTARTYFSTVWIRIYGLVGEQDMNGMNAEAFEEVYSQILEDSSSLGMRRKLARTLLEFHEYMVKVHLSPPMDGSLFGIGNTLTPVDANIITIEEFHKTLRLLEDSDLILLHQDFSMIAQLITILAFRCGLRRSEVLKLRIIDVQGIVQPEILVRPHATRRLKTRNSTRRILLTSLLESDELNLLLEWAKKRQEQESNHKYSPFLFSIPGKGYAYVPEELIFPAIHAAMRQAAKDETLRFHHFRHSCASWAILRLMIADYGMPQGFFEHLPETPAWLEKSSDFKNSLYGNDCPTRKHLYAVASILGHSSPDITLEHYIHCCDIVLYHVLARSLKTLDKKDLTLASGLAQSTAFRLLAKGNSDALLKAVRKKETGRWVLSGNPSARHGVGSAQSLMNEITPPSAYSVLDRAWKLLYLHSAQDMPLEDLAERYRFTEKEAEALVREATRISSLHNKGRYHSYRHRMLTTENDERLICPIRPRGDDARILAENFAERLFHLLENNRNEYMWLLSYYLENAWTRSSDMIFRDADKAYRFLNIIDALNISKSSLQFTWYHGRKRIDVTDAVRLRHWRDALHLPRRIKIHDKKLNDTRPLGKYGWLGIRLINYLGREKDKTSHAYRYVLIMSAICTKGLTEGPWSQHEMIQSAMVSSVDSNFAKAI